MAANFENFLISPDFPINFRKSHQTSKNYLSFFFAEETFALHLQMKRARY